MNQTLKKGLASIILIALFIWVGLYVKAHGSQFKEILQSISAIKMVFLLGVSLIFIVFQGLILKTVLEPFAIKLCFKEWFGISVATLLGNYLFPFVGLGMRALYFKNNYKLKYADFLSLTAAAYLIEFIVFTLAGLLSIVFGYFGFHFIDWKLVLFFVTILSLVFLFALISRWPKIQSLLGQKASSIFALWPKISRSKGVALKLFYLTIGEFISFTSIIFFAYRGLNFPVSFVQSFQPAALSDYAFVVRILPASFGFYEGAIVYFDKLFELNLAQGLSVALLSRLAVMIWAFTLGILFSCYLLSKKPSKKSAE